LISPQAAALFSTSSTALIDAAARARLSAGSTGDRAVYHMVGKAIAARHRGGGTLIDVGCGRANLLPFVRSLCDRYVGVDVVRNEYLPAGVEFIAANLDRESIEVPADSGDIVVAVETIEHLENPRALVRELVRLAKPGGLVFVTTPNQLSLLSLLTLAVKQQFSQFQERPGLYPAHLTALLEIDLVRIANESRLIQIETHWSNHGRVPLTARHWPCFCGGRLFSDNIMITGRKPFSGHAVCVEDRGNGRHDT
jgi:SAM-dependent methyltransferase